MEWWKLRGRGGGEQWEGDWASSRIVVLCPRVVLVVSSLSGLVVPSFRVFVVVLSSLVPRVSVGVRWCSFCGVTAVPLFVVVGSVVVVVLCRGVGVMVWWGSRCVVVTWSSCGDVVIVW